MTQFIEQDCTIEHEGRKFSAGGAIVTLDTKTLWSILCSGNALTERFCNELTWAKAELRRRGFVIA